MSGLVNPEINRFAYPMPMVSTWSREGPVGREVNQGLTPASGTYSTANRAFYYPLVMSGPYLIKRFWWLNGATVGTNNIQMGLYRNDGSEGGPGTRLINGTSTLSAGSANSIQFDDITDTQIGPGTYWLAIWGSGNTMTLFRSAASQSAVPFYLENSLASGLPATATPVAPTAAAIYVCGITNRASP